MRTTINVGDYALHKVTGKLGQVVAHGHEMIDSVYLPTLKVEVVTDTELNQKDFVEDVTSEWLSVEKKAINNN
jgi:hypothetical protein